MDASLYQEDVKALAEPVLQHRVVTNFHADAEDFVSKYHRTPGERRQLKTMKRDAIVDMDLLGRLSGLSLKVSGAVGDRLTVDIEVLTMVRVWSLLNTENTHR